MTQSEMFGKAVWLSAQSFPDAEVEKGGAAHFPILRSEPTIPDTEIYKATLRVVGLGYFHCYLNGTRISDDEFMPIYSDFEPRDNYPTGEKLTGHRLYVPEYDVTRLIKNGKNALCIHFGGGWYTHGYRPAEIYGDAKAIYSLTLETEKGTLKYYSSPENTRVLPVGLIKKYHFAKYEHQDYRDLDESIFSIDYNGAPLEKAAEARPLSDETVYDMTDCPTDKVMRELIPTLTAEKDGIRYYDTGLNLSGFPILQINAPAGERVKVTFSEDVNADGTLNESFTQKQEFTVISDGRERTVRPLFIWFGFRCFSVEGNAQPINVKVVHSSVRESAAFESDNETLNWLYRAFINTQLFNMHSGIPSDCPHIERRGYTGDGQLICRTAMMTLDARSFYRKWITDVCDCQDVLSGNIQYTAPYARCGGGPGGWGCAIVEVPYRYYLRYGETNVLKKAYPQMLRYFDYLESRSENDLVIRSQEGIWCLGEWATPASVVLPAPYVNNYFYVKSLMKAIEIARIIGKEEDVPVFEERIAARKKAIMNAYFNVWDGNFLGNLQGANAYAADIGLGDERTYPNMVEHYKKTKCYDTGIFGTELVTRLMFERGDGDVAVELLTSQKEEHTFDAMRQRGATTLWEYFPGSLRDRSHSHPMFGAVVSCLFESLLGIKPDVGYKSVTVSPVLRHSLGSVKGSVELRFGTLAVEYKISDDRRTAEITVTVPQNTPASFRYGETDMALSTGENRIFVKI